LYIFIFHILNELYFIQNMVLSQDLAK